MGLVPCAVKPATVECTQSCQHGLPRRASPSAPRPLQSLLHHASRPTFHRPTSNRIALCPVLGVAHPRRIRLEIARRLLHLRRIRRLLEVQLCQRLRDLPYLTLPQLIEVGCGPRARRPGTCPKDRIGDLPEPPTGMLPVDDLHRRWEIRAGDALNPDRSIIYRTEPCTLVDAATHPFSILVEGHRSCVPQPCLVAVAG